MGKVTLKSICERKAVINFWEMMANRSGYESNVVLEKDDDGGWTASIVINDMPPQATPEEAIEKLGMYLKSMQSVVKGKNIKKLNIEGIFKPYHTR